MGQKQKNREYKLTRHKKLPNNTVIEIDNCSPPELLQLRHGLLKIAEGGGISFVNGEDKKNPSGK